MRPSGQEFWKSLRGAAASGRGRPPSDSPRKRKSLGQHHLKSGRSCRPLIDFLRLGPGDRVLEIGPGGGILTRELLAAGARVVAVELDPSWALDLPRRAGAFQIGEKDSLQAPVGGQGEPTAARPLSIVVADALELAWKLVPSGWRVAGNLPYNVGTPIVERFLRGVRPGTRAAFLLQREVVDRMVAHPGDEAYGALSVLVAVRARSVRLGIVKPGAFQPPPKVESAFVGLESVVPPLAEDDLPAFERLVQIAFGQRRKSLRNALGSGFDRDSAERALRSAGIDPARRAEELALDDFLRLLRAMAACGESTSAASAVPGTGGARRRN